ncbi:hypothetical protein GGD65_001617 [Bradyrhizobium sp. CIR18]|nr:hypothetical protein [Bradyrhizobium sp. CIR18]
MITSHCSLSQAEFAARVDNVTKAAITDGAIALRRSCGGYPVFTRPRPWRRSIGW